MGGGGGGDPCPGLGTGQQGENVTFICNICWAACPLISDRVSTEVTFWHSAEYGSDFRCNSGEIPRNSEEFRGISPELRRNHFRSQKIPRNSVSAEFRGHPNIRPSVAGCGLGGGGRGIPSPFVRPYSCASACYFIV
jgi:hypothetical protein